MRIKIFQFIILAVIISVSSGCVKKPASINNVVPDKGKNQDQNHATSSGNVLPKEEIKYLENGEIDTSDWQNYKSEKIEIELRIPKKWIVLNTGDSKAGIILRSPHYVPLNYGENNEYSYEGEIYINTINNDKKLRIIELVRTFDDESQFWLDKYAYTNNSISGRDILTFKDIKEGEYFKEVSFVDINGYIISLTYLHKIDDSDLEKIFSTIVSSIKKL